MTAKWAELLLLLQNVDLKIRELKKRLALLPAERKRLTEKLESLQHDREEASKQLKSIELAIKNAESEIASHQQAVTKLQQQSAMVKKNSEYQAMLSQIAALKIKIGDLESTILEKYDEQEAAKLKVQAVNTEVDSAMRSTRAEIAELDEFAVEIKKDIEEKTAEREKLSAGVEKTLLSRYNQLLSRGQGMPLASAAGGICKNCNLRLTPQTLNEARQGKVTYCDNCMHIIYFEE